MSALKKDTLSWQCTRLAGFKPRCTRAKFATSSVSGNLLGALTLSFGTRSKFTLLGVSREWSCTRRLDVTSFVSLRFALSYHRGAPYSLETFALLRRSALRAYSVL